MIVNSGHPVEVCEFPEGWEDDLVLGVHNVSLIIPGTGVVPELIKTDVDYESTLHVARLIIANTDADYRALDSASVGSLEHRLQIRVGDLACNGLIRNMPFRAGMTHRNNEGEGRLIGDLPPRPFLFRGRALYHQDGNPGKGDSDSVLYTLTNQEGTLHYEQRFWKPIEGGGILSYVAAPVLHAQARPGAAIRARDNVLYRTYANRDVHAADRQQPWLDKQRVFIKNKIYRVKEPQGE
jgi:hypothetical protein